MSQSSSLTAAPPLATRAPAVARRSKRHVRGTLPVLVLFLPPALLLFTVFVILPMGEAAWYSFYNWNGYGLPTQWVGTKNYELIFNNGAFRQALINNGLIIVVSIIIQIPLALWIATMVTHRIKGAVMFRLLFFLPYVLADVAAGMIWRFVYDGQFGLVAGIFNTFGMEAPFWLADRQVAFYAVLGVIVWKYFGFHMMLFVAGLQSIDKSVLEAADIDGATGWQKFYRVTLPMLGSTVRLSVFFAVIGSLQLFDMIMPLTGGGPSNSTQTLVTFGVVLFVICVVLAFSYKRIFMKND
jgi:raffinose/stachyose/melibiose transport system permease protein